MFAATKRCVVMTDNAVHKFNPGDDIGRLPKDLIDKMVEQGQAYEVEVIEHRTVADAICEAVDEIGSAVSVPEERPRKQRTK